LCARVCFAFLFLFQSHHIQPDWCRGTFCEPSLPLPMSNDRTRCGVSGDAFYFSTNAQKLAFE
jgi:hypothetical protein